MSGTWNLLFVLMNVLWIDIKWKNGLAVLDNECLY